MPTDPFTLTIDATRYALSLDQEHGTFYARFACPTCPYSSISDKPCSSEDEALAEARYRAQLHHASHRPKKSPPSRTGKNIPKNRTRKN